MTWPVVVLGTLWVGLVAARAVERRPVRRVAVLRQASQEAGRTSDDAPRRRRRPVALSGRSKRWDRTVLTMAVALVALLMFGPVGAALAGVCVPLLSRVREQRSSRARLTVLRARLPDAMDFLVVAGAAGLAPRQALGLVAQRGPPELRPAFAEVVARAGRGEPWARAVPHLVSSVGEPARAIVHAIVAAEQDGAPMGTVLSRLADDARRQRRHDLEAAVRRLPVRLSFPLVCCSLPAFVLLTVVPLVAAGLRRLGPVAL
jgi:Flp pilus assembly protein TadB